MAWLEQEPSGRYHVAFRYGTRKYKRSLRTTRQEEAGQLLRRVERRLQLLESGDIDLPVDVDLPTFLLTNGKHPQPLKLTTERTLKSLFDVYRKTIDDGSMEATTQKTARIHLSHIQRILGARLDPSSVNVDRVQQYIDRRKREPGQRGRCVSPTTIRKEISTFRSVWKWAASRNLVSGQFPTNGLQYPKGEEKPPFMTWGEISLEIERGGLDEHEIAQLWDCLYLQSHEIEAALNHARAFGLHPFIHPMMTTAAYTGARRSELVRAEIRDVDLNNMKICIREKKRNRQKRTYRTVPLAPALCRILTKWLSDHPGGRHLFCLTQAIRSGGTAHLMPEPLTPDEATDHFNRTFEDSKWQVLRGWHVFRHSFASNCASKGIDQRLIDEWMGHQTEEMVKRYRHLFPDVQAKAISSVFSSVK